MIEKKVVSLQDIGENKCVVIGDEGCIYRAFNQKNLEIAKYCANNGIQIRYVTPMIPEFFMEKAVLFVKKIATIAESVVLKITFNDLGFFYNCFPIIDSFEPVIGRIISRSIIDCPWYNQLIFNETEEIKNALTGYTFYHSSKQDMLSLYGIKEVELNIATHQHLRALLEQNITITVYGDSKLISTSRICYSAAIMGYCVNNECSVMLCNDKIPFSLYKLWDKKSRMRIEPSMESIGLYDNLYIQGTQVFSPVTMEEYDTLLKEKNIHNLII